jgi:hypothetical protein
MPNKRFTNPFHLKIDAEGYCLHPETGKRICGRTNRKNRPCDLPPAIGRKCCRFHGGASLVGEAAPNFKHGRYSSMLPTRMLAHYERLKDDPQFDSLRSEIALIRTRISDLLQRLDSGEVGQIWIDLRTTWQEMNQARQRDDMPALANALNEIGGIIERGMQEQEAWRDIGREIDRVGRLVTQETRQQQISNATISVEQALLWAGAVGSILREYISDPEILSGIAVRIRSTLMAPSGRLLDAGIDAEDATSED